MSNMKFKGLLAGAAVGAIFALSGGQASAATCDPAVSPAPDAGDTSAVNITQVGSTVINPKLESSACAKTTKTNPSSGDGETLLDELNGSATTVGLFDSFYTGSGETPPDWQLVGTVNANDGSAGEVEVTVPNFGTSGTWTADFDAMIVSEVVIALKSGNNAAAFLFSDIDPTGNIFEGDYDTELAGLVNTSGDGQALSNLTSAGVFVRFQADPPSPIPLPAGLPLILTGLGLFGALRLRKAKTA